MFNVLQSAPLINNIATTIIIKPITPPKLKAAKVFLASSSFGCQVENKLIPTSKIIIVIIIIHCPLFFLEISPFFSAFPLIYNLNKLFFFNKYSNNIKLSRLSLLYRNVFNLKLLFFNFFKSNFIFFCIFFCSRIFSAYYF